MTIFNQAIRRIAMNKMRLLILLIIPLLFIMMFAMQEDRSLTIGVVDQDKSILSDRLIAELADLHQVKVERLEESAVYSQTISYQIDYTLIIREGFESRIRMGEQPLVQEFYLNGKNHILVVQHEVERSIQAMIDLAAGVGNDNDRFHAVFEQYGSSVSNVSDGIDDGKVQSQERVALGFLVQFMLYTSVITAGVVSEDKRSGVFYRVFYAPVSLRRYLLENMAAFLLIGIVQVAIILSLLATVFKMNFGGNLSLLFLLFVLFSLVCVSLGLWIVSLFQKPMTAYITIVFITTPLVMLGGCYWTKDSMPELFQRIALFIPTTWVMDGVDRILQGVNGIADLTLEMVILLLFSCLFLAAGIFKKVDVSRH